MLSFNRKYGLGAALRQRSIWSGPARSAPGMVVQQLNPYRPRTQTNPANIALENIVYNGVAYLGKTGNAGLYTTTDVVTFTARTIGGVTFINGLGVIGSTFCAVWTGGGQYVLSVSTDNGVTWTGAFNTGITSPVMFTAGGIGYLFAPGSTNSFTTFNAAGAMTVRTFPATTIWANIISVGTTWFVLGNGVGAYSTDGISFTLSASYATEAAKLQTPVTAIYVLGNRFIAIAFSGLTFSTIYSDNGGLTWQQGARYGDLSNGRLFSSVNLNGAVLDGHLYISAAAGGIGFIMSTADGVSWRVHNDFGALTTLPGLYKINSLGTFVFNTAKETIPLLEANPTAQELYYEL